MVENCYICGTPTIIEINGKKYCPNCGLIEENKEYYEKTEHKDEYIG